MSGQWGHCKNCRHFASPAPVPLGGEEALCKQPVLARYKLTVFGACGCTGFQVRAGISKSVEQPAPGPSHPPLL